MTELVKPGGTLSFFEYIAIRRARAMVSTAEEKTRLRGIGATLDRLLAPVKSAATASGPTSRPPGSTTCGSAGRDCKGWHRQLACRCCEATEGIELVRRFRPCRDPSCPCGTPTTSCRCHPGCRIYYAFFGGAGPTFLFSLAINSSKRARAFFQLLLDIGTPHSPMPLQLFSPGLAPQPPWPRHSLSAWQLWALAVAQAPGRRRRYPWRPPSPLHMLMPRQTCGSPSMGFLFLSFFGASSAAKAACSRAEPAISPPIAAAVKRSKSRRFKLFFPSM